MNWASVKKVILMFFSGNDPICHSQKFQPSLTPHSHFLPISPRFLTDIRCRYFSFYLWVVYDHLKLDWCIFDQNWAKTRPLHFQIFQILNATDRRIVQCIFYVTKLNKARASIFTAMQCNYCTMHIHFHCNPESNDDLTERKKRKNIWNFHPRAAFDGQTIKVTHESWLWPWW